MNSALEHASIIYLNDSEIGRVCGGGERPTISPKTESALCKATWAGLGTLAGSIGGPLGAAAGAAGGTFLGETICLDPAPVKTGPKERVGKGKEKN